MNQFFSKNQSHANMYSNAQGYRHSPSSHATSSFMNSYLKRWLNMNKNRTRYFGE